MNEKEYNEIPALRATELIKFMDAPSKLKHYRLQPEELIRSSALRTGTYIHQGFYEGNTDGYFVWDKGKTLDGRTAKKTVDAFFEEYNAGDYPRGYITQAEKIECDIMLNSINHLRPEGGNVESYHGALIEGVHCKCRVDWTDRIKIQDLKTTQTAHPDRFIYECYKYGYFDKLAFYSLITGIDDIEILAVEREAPYLYTYFDISERVAERKEVVLSAIRAYKAWTDAGEPEKSYTSMVVKL